jgi:hypothetical protein
MDWTEAEAEPIYCQSESPRLTQSHCIAKAKDLRPDHHIWLKLQWLLTLIAHVLLSSAAKFKTMARTGVGAAHQHS